MAFTVEDGTGVTDANAYIATADADAYFVERAVASWAAAADDVKKAAIIRATDYIEARFGQRFMGTKLVSTQGLSFPRDDLFDREGKSVDGMPVPFLSAVCEYAVRALGGTDLWNEPFRDPKGRLVVDRKKVGPIEKDLRYAFNRDVQEIKPVPGADRLIQQYCTPTGVAYR